MDIQNFCSSQIFFKLVFEAQFFVKLFHRFPFFTKLENLSTQCDKYLTFTWGCITKKSFQGNLKGHTFSLFVSYFFQKFFKGPNLAKQFHGFSFLSKEENMPKACAKGTNNYSVVQRRQTNWVCFVNKKSS